MSKSRSQSEKYLPKGYKGPIKGYQERIEKYNSKNANSVIVTTQKPSINPISKSIMAGKQVEEPNTWSRLYKEHSKLEANRSELNLLLMQSYIESIPEFKPELNKKVPKYLRRYKSESSIEA